MANNSQIPLQFVWTDSTGRLTQPAAFWLQQLQNGINTNTDTVNNITNNPTTITLTGDVSGSGTTSIPTALASVNTAPGTYGSPSTVPVITVDSKGRVISVIQEPISVGGGSGTVTVPGGGNGAIQFNSGGNFAGDVNLTYVPNTGTLYAENVTVANVISSVTANISGTLSAATANISGTLSAATANISGTLSAATANITTETVTTLNVTNEAVTGQITFSNPIQTLNNLLPAQVGNSGEVLTTNGTNASWEPISAIIATVSGVIIGDTDCGPVTNPFTAKVDLGKVSDMPYSTVNLGVAE